MSQSGLLTEEEIKDYINEVFNLKLSREAFLNPNKDTVTDIYTRFLDDTGLKWKKARNVEDDLDDPTRTRARMAGRIKFLFSRYNCPHEFGLMDLLEPTRKRTTAFLNVFIFIKAQIDDARIAWQEMKEEWLSTNSEAENINRQVGQMKLKIEELALEKSRIGKSKDQLRLEIENERSSFELLQREGEALAEEAQNVKANLLDVAERHDRKKLEYEARFKSVKEQEATLQALNEGRIIKTKIQNLKKSIDIESDKLKSLSEENQRLKSEVTEKEKLASLLQLRQEGICQYIDEDEKMFARTRQELEKTTASLDRLNAVRAKLEAEEKLLKEQISDREQIVNKMKLEYKIKIEQARGAMEMKRATESDKIKSQESEIDQLKGYVKTLSLQITEINSKHAALLEKRKNEDERKLRKSETMKKRLQESAKVLQPKLASLHENRSKLESLLYGSKEIEQPSVHKDRTYIKE